MESVRSNRTLLELKLFSGSEILERINGSNRTLLELK